MSCEVTNLFFQPADELTVQEVLKCALKIFLGDPSSLPRTANLLEILGSVTVSYTFLLNNYILVVLFIAVD